jgi:hypothetical protein
MKSFWDDRDGTLLERTEVLLVDLTSFDECFERELLFLGKKFHHFGKHKTIYF